MDIKVRIEQRYQLTIGQGEHETVLNNAKKETAASGALSIWTGQYHVDGNPRTGTIITLNRQASGSAVLADLFGGMFGTIADELILAADEGMLERAGLYEEARADVSIAVASLESAAAKLRDLDNPRVAGGVGFLMLVERITNLADSFGDSCDDRHSRNLATWQQGDGWAVPTPTGRDRDQH